MYYGNHYCLFHRYFHLAILKGSSEPYGHKVVEMVLDPYVQTLQLQQHYLMNWLLLLSSTSFLFLCSFFYRWRKIILIVCNVDGKLSSINYADGWMNKTNFFFCSPLNGEVITYFVSNALLSKSCILSRNIFSFINGHASSTKLFLPTNVHKKHIYDTIYDMYFFLSYQQRDIHTNWWYCT